MNYKAIVIIFLSFSIGFSYCKPSDKKKTSTINQIAKDSLTIDFYSQKIREDALNPSWYALRGDKQFESGKITEAIEDYQLALQLDSSQAIFYLKIAEFNLNLGKSEKTKQALEECLKLYPEHTDAMLKMAELNLYARQYKPSMEYLVKAIRLDDQLAKAYYLKAIIYEETGDTALAITNLQIASNKEPKMYPAYMKLGSIYAKKQDSLALDYFRIAIMLNEKSIEAYYNIAMFYQENELYQKAIDKYNLLLQHADPEFYEAYFNKGYIYLEFLHNYPKAIEEFTKAIELKNNYYQAYHNRGLANELAGNFIDARKDYLLALNILPNYSLSLDGINRIHQKTNN